MQIKARQRGRELSIKLTETGASLYDLLGKEKENQDKRSSQMGRQMESSNVEQILRTALASSTAKMNADKDQLDNLLKEKQAVSAKVERKRADLERLRQRLDTLQKIRYWLHFIIFDNFDLFTIFFISFNYFWLIFGIFGTFTLFVTGLHIPKNSKKPKKSCKTYLANISYTCVV